MTRASPNPVRLTVVAFAAALLLPTTLGASNLTFRSTLNTWSKQIGTDAASVALAARQRHPRLMTSQAVRFHRDALHARRHLATQTVTTVRLRRARRLAVRAFTYYASAGTEWAASGRFRLSHQRADSITAAKSGGRDANIGSQLLRAAAALTR